MQIEEMHRQLCCMIIRFIPPITPSQLPGSVFRTFLQNLISKTRGAEHKMSPSDASSNSTLVSLFTVILYFLSEGFSMDDLYDLMGSTGNAEVGGGFLHRGGKRKFSVALFLNSDSHRNWISRVGGSINHLLKSNPIYDEKKVMLWDEGCMDDCDTRITHSTRQKPCCCSFSEADIFRTSKDNVKCLGKSSKGPCTSIPERSVNAECAAGSLNDGIVDKPSSSDPTESNFGYQTLQHLGSESIVNTSSLDVLREEELLDIMLFLYHLGVAPKFRQAGLFILNVFNLFRYVMYNSYED